MKAATLSKEQEALFESWYFDPDKFERDIWPAATDAPEKWQTQFSRLVVENDRIAVRSGHGIGKTAKLARTIIWWGSTRHPWKVGCTAPSSGQMFDALWSELAKWHSKMPDGFKELFEWKAERFEWAKSPAVSYAVAKTARRETPEALAGLHSENMLFIIDEASGVDDIIFETARGAMSTRGAKTIMTGNPTRLSGYFFDAFHKNLPHWATMKVAAHESTRCNLKELAQWKEEYGEDSNFFRVRALGEFPDAEDGTIIPLYLAESAVTRDVAPVASEEIWGLDVSAAGKDLCALAKRRGNIMPAPVKTWRSDDLMVSAGIVAQEYRDAANKPMQICVDSNGIGAGVAHALAQQGLPIHCVNVSESHSTNDRYLRLRDEMWERAREWFYGRDVKIPNDAYFVGEITRVKWRPTPNGKMGVMSKYEMKLAPPRGLGKSPDRAEAFCFTFMGVDFIVRKPKVFKYPALGLA